MRIAICDDESVQLDILERMIVKCTHWLSEVQEIVRFTNGNQLLKTVKNNNFDCIFLDIQMPEIDGINLFREINRLKQTRIIFVSTHTEQLPNALALNPTSFLHKPYSQETFNDAVKRMNEKIRDEHIFIYYEHGRQKLLPCSQVRYLEISDHYLYAFIDKRFFVTSARFDDVESELVPYGFFRCHRSYLVNMRYFAERNNKKICLEGADGIVEVPLAKDRATKFDAAYLKYKLGGNHAF